jgi:glycosyltransferase involved in cell wall biosynthesis
MRKGKIFIGLNNIAGTSASLKYGFENIGFKSDFYSAEKNIYKEDFIGGISAKRVPSKIDGFYGKFKFFWFFTKLLLNYRYFIFLQSNWTLLNNYLDVKLLRFFGKKCAVILTGCDARVPSAVIKYKWNVCENCTDKVKKSVGCNIPWKEKNISRLPDIFNIVFSPMECSGLLRNNYYDILFPRPLRFFKPSYPAFENLKITIVHAPTNVVKKGTKFIRNVIQELGREYDNFEYIELQDLPPEKLYDIIRSCDLVIDQMLVGFYGLMAVESMALGKPVVVYIHPDKWDQMKDAPIYNANPANLRNVLKEILQNPKQLYERGIASRKYVEKYHESDIIAANIMSYFK